MSNTAIQKRNNQQNTVHVPERINQSATFTPLVDIIETNEEFIFQADLPGVRPGDVDVSYENGTLTIAASVQPRQPEQQTRYIWQDYGIGNFYRQFLLNTPIEPDQVKAELKNGVLELHVPKSESAKTRKIEIKST